MGIQGVVLEHQPHAAIFRRQMGHIVLAEEDLSLRRLQQAADEIQRRALAAAGGAQQTDELPVGDLEREVIDGDDIAARLFVAVGELLGQMLQRDLHGSVSLPVFCGPPPPGGKGRPRYPRYCTTVPGVNLLFLQNFPENFPLPRQVPAAPPVHRMG